MALAVVLYSFHHLLLLFNEYYLHSLFSTFSPERKSEAKSSRQKQMHSCFCRANARPQTPKGGFSDSLDFGYTLR